MDIEQGILIGILAVALLVAGLLVWRRRRAKPRLAAVTGTSANESDGLAALPLEVADGELVVFPGNSDGEVVVYASSERAALVGREVGAVPAEVARRATALAPNALDAAVQGGRATGRLLVVDKATAAAIRANTTRDASGNILPLVRDSAGRIKQLARLKDVANVSTLTSLTGAAAAVATQAQLQRIEQAVAAVAEQVSEMAALDELERVEERRAVAQILGRVYRVASNSQTLSHENWSQVQSEALTVRTHLNVDMRRLEQSIRKLEEIAGQGAKARSREVEEAVREVRIRQASLVQSAQSWAQLSAMRLWKMQIDGDKSLAAAEAEMRAELEQWSELPALRDTAHQALIAMQKVRWHENVLHPVSARRLPRQITSARDEVTALPWDALAGRRH